MLLSILIPTKNRYNTLIPVLNALTKNILSDDLEFIIQDNSDSPQPFADAFRNNEDKRIKYFYEAGELSIKENTIKALENAKGKYLTFIGDDDLLSPYIYEIVSYINARDIGCLIYNAGYYWWQSVEFAKSSHYHRKGAFWCPEYTQKIEKKDAESELNIVLNAGAGGLFNLPRFYHGIVQRSILEQIKRETGSYLNGSSPDMAFSLSIALVVKEYYYLDYPVSIYGASKNSGGGWTASKKHYGKIEDQKHLPKNIIETWDPFLPRIWSEKTIYAQTAIEVLTAFKSLKKINYEGLYGTMLAYEPYVFKYIMPAMSKHIKTNFHKYIAVLAIFIKKRLGMSYRYLKYQTHTFGYSVTIVDNVDSLIQLLKAEAQPKIRE